MVVKNDGVYISERYSEDGSIHYINSNEEYMSYLIEDNGSLFDHINRRCYHEQVRRYYELNEVKVDSVSGLLLPSINGL